MICVSEASIFNVGSTKGFLFMSHSRLQDEWRLKLRRLKARNEPPRRDRKSFVSNIYEAEPRVEVLRWSYNIVAHGPHSTPVEPPWVAKLLLRGAGLGGTWRHNESARASVSLVTSAPSWPDPPR